MQKHIADAIITEYTKRIFGFALSKTGRIADAEELAARITLEVYASLLRSSEVANLDGYVYRIARNVYARHTDESIRGAHLSLNADGVDVRSSEDFVAALIESETFALLRREIAYLTKTQRDIVVLHYYDRLKQTEIASRLSLPVGTVKWHLHEAKTALKEGITLKREPGTLGVKPIKLTALGHSGTPGTLGDTAHFLAKRITQNIAYAAYWGPKTIREIAEELNVSPIFVEDEVAVLEEYGFMERLAGDKFRTQIYISDMNAETMETLHVLYTKYAKIVCDKYVPAVIDFLKNRDNSDIYVPDGDFNLLLWAVIPCAMGIKLYDESNAVGRAQVKYSIKRPDGGDYIACAVIEYEPRSLSFDLNKYNACGNMNRGSMKGYPQRSWQLDTYYDIRPLTWVENKAEDYDYLYEFYTGKLEKNDANLEKFNRLYEKQYLDETDAVNLIVIRDDCEQMTWDNAFTQALPGLTDELRTLGAELDAAVGAIYAPLYPPHMQELSRLWSTSSFTNNELRTRVLEQLVADGVLTLPAEKRKGGLTTLMFSAELPK